MSAPPSSKHSVPAQEAREWSPMAPAANASAIGWKAKKRKSRKSADLMEPVNSHFAKQGDTEKKTRDLCGKRNRTETALKSGVKEPDEEIQLSARESTDLQQEQLDRSATETELNLDPEPSKQEPAVEISVQWDDDLTAVVSLSGPVCLVGRATVELVLGQVEMLGYRLSEPTQSVAIESPAWSNAVTLVPLAAGTTVRVDSARPSGGASFEIRSPSDADTRPTVIPDSWSDAMDSVLEDLASAPTNQRGARVVFAGAKNVGKSTSLRYSIHRMLCSETHQVALLDCDAGQPELSPPGMVSLTVVQFPMLSPPHFHMVMDEGSVGPKRHVESYFFGSTTSKEDPTLYLKCIKKLLARYEKLVKDEYNGDECRLPLLVNTDGWVKSMGLEILSALIDVISPAHIIQIQGAARSKQFDLSSIVTDEEVTLHVVYSYDVSGAVGSGPSRTSSVASLGSLDVEMAGPAASISAQSYRSLRLCTYFLGSPEIWDRVEFSQNGILDYDCEIANHLAAARPYKISLDNIRCIVRGACMRDLVTEDSLLSVLNCSIVGLCCSREATGPDTEHSPTRDDCLSCVGLGLVRSIDRHQRLMYVLTPVNPHDLKSVDTLVLGGIQVPFECVYGGVHSVSFTYLNCHGVNVGIGADVMKSRNTLVRKGNAPA